MMQQESFSFLHNHNGSRTGTALIISPKRRMKANARSLAYVGSKPAGGSDCVADGERDADSWNTPKRYIELVRQALGGSIDFDPFSSHAAQKTVRAKAYYTVEDDALDTPWPDCETAFMNPPYSKEICALAMAMFAANFDQGKFKRGIVLVNNATDTAWWSDMTNHAGCAAICLTRGRIGFENVDGKAVSGNTRGQAFMLFQAGGQRKRRDAIAAFRRSFDAPSIGRVWQ